MKKCNLIERFFTSFLWLFMHIPITSKVAKPFSQKYYLYLLKKAKRKGPGRIYKVDEVRQITRLNFFLNYFLSGKPLIFKASKIASDPNFWSFKNLKENFPQEPTVITDKTGINVLNLSQSIDEILDKTARNARICNLLQTKDKLRKHINFALISKYLFAPYIITSYQLFLGRDTNYTPLHAGMTNNFSIQLQGKKRWRLIPNQLNPLVCPELDGGPLHKSELDLSDESLKNDERVKYLDIWEAELEPGDILFNPSFVWHYVEYKSDSISAGLRWLSPYSTLKASFILSLLTLTAYNPSSFKSFRRISKGKTMGFYD